MLFKTNRPRINIPLQSYDYALEILAAIGLLVLLALPVFYYGQLPEQIPTHFGANGLPDKFGPKLTLWLLPIVGLCIYGLMTFVNRRPDWFNFPVKITAENAARQYGLAVRLIRLLKAMVTVLFAYLVWGTIHVAHGGSDGLNSWVLALPLATLGIAIAFMFVSATNK